MTTSLLILVVVAVCHMTSGTLTPIDERIAAASNHVYSAVNDDGSILAELDVMYTPEQWAARHEGHLYAAQMDEKYRWPDKIIPFDSTSDFTGSEWQKIEIAMQEWEYYTCVRFRKRTTEQDYVYFAKPATGCNSFIGRVGGRQVINLGSGCVEHSIVTHEIGHAIGLFHQHRRPDRDNFVTIQYENIQAGLSYAFNKVSDSEANTYGIPYDYTSLMHYGRKAFSKNNKDTIVAKNADYMDKMGTAPTVRFSDIRIVNLMYRCADWCGLRSCPPNGMVNQYCQCWCGYNNIDVNPVYVCGLGGPNVTITAIPTRMTTPDPIRTTRGLTTGPACIIDCYQRTDGNYQDCKRCDVFISCVGGRTIRDRACPAGLVWDDRLKQCNSQSTTCIPPRPTP